VRDESMPSGIKRASRSTSALVSLEAPDQIEFTDSLTIGRHPLNKLVLGHARISSRHASIEWTDRGWRIRDLGSRNGTSIDGKKFDGSRSLRAGHVIRFGGVSSWKVETLVEPSVGVEAIAFVENTASSRRFPVECDRFLIGTGPPCDLVIEEWLDTHPSPIRAVLFEESGALWAEPAVDVPDLVLDGKPWTSRAVKLDRDRMLRAGATELRLIPAVGDSLVRTTERLVHRPKKYDLDLYLVFDGPAEGTIRIDVPGNQWSIHTGQRFILLVLLARAKGEWVVDADLRVGLWGRAGLEKMEKGALYKLIHDTRQMFVRNGVDGWFIEKNAGRTRLRIPPARIQLTELG